MKITNEIHQIGGGNLSSFDDAAVYLIDFDGHAAVVDAGCGGSVDKILMNMEKCGVWPNQVEYLLLTHCHFDHTGGAKALKDVFQCPAVCHESDAPFLERGDNAVTAASWYGATISPFKIDKKVQGAGTAIDLAEREIRAIHTPGHSPGSMVYVAESEGFTVLFGQDIHGPLDPSLLSDRKKYKRSLNLLLSLEADILCEGHFGVYRGKKEVAKFIRSYL